MKTPLKREFTVYISLTAAIASGLIAIIFISGNKEYYLLYPIVSILLVFLLTYLVTWSFLKKIPNSNIVDEKPTWKNLDKSFNEVNQDAISLASNQVREIDRLIGMEQYGKEYIGNVSLEL